MDYEFSQSPFSKAVLTGVFVGFFSTVLCLIYNVIFRDETGFLPADIINVSSLIFFVNLVFFIIGIIYFAFQQIKKGDLLFMIFFILLTIFFIWKTEGVVRSPDHEITIQFRELLLGVVIIMGVGAFFIPILFHNKGFQKHVI